jgi:TonB family protein
MKALIVFFSGMLLSTSASAQMVSGDSINDPIRAKACAARALESLPHDTIASFEIDRRVVLGARSITPDATFIALGGGAPQLFECWSGDKSGTIAMSGFAVGAGWRLIESTKPGSQSKPDRLASQSVFPDPKIVPLPKLSGPIVKRAVATLKRDPVYPSRAVPSKLEGTELLSITIDVYGNPTDIKVVHSLGPEFDEEAIRAMRSWLFEPARDVLGAVTSEATVEMNFRFCDAPAANLSPTKPLGVECTGHWPSRVCRVVGE